MIQSLTTFLTANPVPDKTMTIKTMIGANTFDAETLPKNDPFVNKTLTTDLSKIDHQAKITMQSSSKDSSYYNISMMYFLPAKDVPSRDE